MRTIEAARARSLLHGGGEIAFLDIREAGAFGEGHPLFAVPAPHSRLEAMIGRLVPRMDVPVILFDGNDGVAARAAARLAALGYRDVAVLADGIDAWSAAGFPIYKGVNVPSKTLGELAEAAWHPRTVRADELAAWQARGKPFAFFDARPAAEHGKMRVPGSRCLPNGELAHRLAAVAPEPETPIVITCAGRTRGLIGAIGLRLAGHTGPVYALENGTQGWALAGFPLERDNRAEPFPPLDAAGKAQARERAKALMRRFGIASADAEAVAAMRSVAGRTTYLFDVRSPDEAAADPLPAAVHAPGGQLVQATDQWVGVRRARIVLADDEGLRAALAAFWLQQMGYEPVVVPITDALRGMPAPARPEAPRKVDRISAETALARHERGALVLPDLRGSMAYRSGHVVGAEWSIRPRLPALRSVAGREVAIVTDESVLGDLAAVDLAELGAGRVSVIEGGQAALEEAGAQIERTPGHPSDAEAIDHLFFVHDRHDGNLDASRRYLEWETGLVDQLDPPERAEFRVIAPD